MRIVIAVLALLTLWAGPAAAQDDDLTQRVATAKTLVQLTSNTSMSGSVIDAVWPQIQAQILAKATSQPDPQVLVMLKAAFTQTVQTATAQVLDDAATAYANNFTGDELTAMVDFYGSPVGKKMVTLQPKIMSQLMPSIAVKIKTLLPPAIQSAIDEAKQQGLAVGGITAQPQ